MFLKMASYVKYQYKHKTKNKTLFKNLRFFVNKDILKT